MVKINPLPENPYPMYCKWCGRLICYATTKNSDGICTYCARNAIARWKPVIKDTAIMHHKLIITAQEDQ
jgi:hypothetical protein